MALTLKKTLLLFSYLDLLLQQGDFSVQLPDFGIFFLSYFGDSQSAFDRNFAGFLCDLACQHASDLLSASPFLLEHGLIEHVVFLCEFISNESEQVAQLRLSLANPRHVPLIKLSVIAHVTEPINDFLAEICHTFFSLKLLINSI